MRYLRSKVIGLFMIGLLAMAAMPVTGYANSCAEKKQACYSECNEVMDGESNFAEIARIICKGGCNIALLICNSQ